MSQSKDKMSEIDEHILKRFDVHKRLGKGAYGIVWKAIDRRSKEVVAIKKIFDAFRNQTDAQRTFREIMFLRSFKDHPNIVKLHSIHRAANNKDIYLGFEYMETDLHNVIKRGNILKDVHKRYIMYQLLKATKYIHSGNVIHRDQKPSNVLLDSLCRCKIADFGLARSLTQVADDNSCDTDPTLTDYVATRWYRAPEILIANRKYTKGIDMWSLGCILGEMLLGKPIFPGTSTFNQVEKIMASIPTPSADDINQVCVAGLGPSMIKNAASIQKVPLKTLLGHNVAEDALDLVNKLLLFNPYKRLTAAQALKHQYVSRFHNANEEIEMKANVLPPLNDDIRVSIDDYRNKLYEMMSSTHHHAVYGQKQPVRALRPRPPLARESRNRVHKEVLAKEKPFHTQSEMKVIVNEYKPKHPMHARSESKITHKTILVEAPKRVGDCQKQVRSSADTPVQRPRKRSMSSKSNIYMSAYNSCNANHGIITQSALMELKAAGIR